MAKKYVFNNCTVTIIESSDNRGGKRNQDKLDFLLYGKSFYGKMQFSPQEREYLIYKLGAKCKCCGYDKNIHGLEIDHIDENHQNWDMKNLQVLCGTCHNVKTYDCRKIHKY